MAREVRVGTQDENLVQRAWRNAAYLLISLDCSSCIPIAPKTDNPRAGTVVLDFPYQSSIQKTHHMLAYR